VTLRRTRIRRVSAKRAEAKEDQRDVRMALFARDHGHCLLEHLPPCAGPWTPHHVRKASHLGVYELANLVTLCAHHNGWVEDHPHVAWGLGLVCREGETLDETTQRRHRAGLR
jgi:hypothetical protein